VAAAIYFPATLIIDSLVVTIKLNREQIPATRQMFAYRELEKSFAATGQVPTKLEDLPDALSGYIDDYEPQAWRLAGRILFLHRHGHLLTITFGDGSQAVATSWFPAKGVPSIYAYRHPFMRAGVVAVYGLLAIVLTTLATRITFREKTR